MKNNTPKISEKNIVEWDKNKDDVVWTSVASGTFEAATDKKDTKILSNGENIGIGSGTFLPDKKDNSFILSCFTLTAVGIFHFFLTWYAIYYDSSIKSSLIIIFGFAIYILSIIIYHLKSVIKEKDKDFHDMGNRWGRAVEEKAESIRQALIAIEKEKIESKEWKTPEWLKAMQDEKLVLEALGSVLKNDGGESSSMTYEQLRAYNLYKRGLKNNLPSHDELTVEQLERIHKQYAERFGTTGKLLLSREERSRRCREGALKRWNRDGKEKDKKIHGAPLTPRQIAGSKGGKKGWEGLTTEQRTQRAKRSARARWNKKNKGE